MQENRNANEDFPQEKKLRTGNYNSNYRRKKIRVHDLRHSHVSLLINMGYTALAIGKRVGHSAEKITYRYAHLFPSVQQDMAEQLDAENMDEELNEVEGGLANVG